MSRSMKLMKGLRLAARLGLAVALATVGLARSPVAHADNLLLASTTMVNGSSAATYSFDAPSAGTVTARISSVPWPVPLASLSFSASSSTQTLASWASSGASALSGMATPADTQTPQVETFQVGAGTYFAHIAATAGTDGALNLGLYSLMLTFTPSAVPLPAAAGLLLMGIFTIFALRSTWLSPRNESVMYPV